MGPLVVTRTPMTLAEAVRGRVAIPGKETTAFRLLRLAAPQLHDTVELRYDKILRAVAGGGRYEDERGEKDQTLAMIVHHPKGAGMKSFRGAEPVPGVRHHHEAFGAYARNRLDQHENQKQHR